MAKKPADHKPAKNSIVTVETPAGAVNIKKFDVKAGFLRKNRHKDEVDIMFLIIEEVATDEALEIIDQLSMEDLKNFFKDWQEESGALLGES